MGWRLPSSKQFIRKAAETKPLVHRSSFLVFSHCLSLDLIADDTNLIKLDLITG